MHQTLVVGASGTVGTELVKELKSIGQKVIRTTTKKQGLASDQVHLDLVSRSGLEQAFDGVDQAFLLSPPGYTNQDELLGAVIDEAKKRGLKKVVLMTAMGANASDELPMRRAELKLEHSGLTWNVIRPNWFMQNFNTFWIHGIKNANKILLPVGRAKTSFIDARDIAATAAVLLHSTKFDNQEFDLTGRESLDHDQVADLMSLATGKAISFQEISPAEMLKGLLSAGLPTAYAEFLIVILGYLREGYAERQTDSVARITGAQPIRFAEYAQDYRQSWL